MKVLKSILTYIKETITSKKTGFYISLIAAILCSISSFIFQFHYKGTTYYSLNPTIYADVGLILFAFLSLFRATSTIGAAFLSLFSLLSMLSFINATYMYFSELFFSGISMSALKSIDKMYVIILVLYLIAIIASNVSVYVRQNKIEVIDNENK
ncbi:MAG TPA: hypothetical protein DEF61_04905 [Firmicutes bacterium]|nr:hypothetical protein [Bacillota bacterium]HBM70596.1 hypothetical protein [Bacillota bacterium]HBX25566.1 hypothetical protein [Bacillota bacterium]